MKILDREHQFWDVEFRLLFFIEKIFWFKNPAEVSARHIIHSETDVVFVDETERSWHSMITPNYLIDVPFSDNTLHKTLRQIRIKFNDF